MRKASLSLIGLCLWSMPLSAEIVLEFQGNVTETHSSAVDFASYKMPIGPYSEGFIQTLVAEGPQTTQAWRIQQTDPTSLAVMDNLRQQVERRGFELLYECETRECGGFDFRFETDVLPEPAMHIDLGDFRYLAAQRLGGAIPEYLSLFVSRSPNQAHVQMISVGGGDASAVPIPENPNVPTTPQAPEISQLLSAGHIILEDLEFVTGSSNLDAKDYASLAMLVQFLGEDRSRQIALVGHTDAVGSLANNISLSRKRAQSVSRRLVELGVSQNQVIADGVGYLSPISSNSTEAGRAKNRRVEAVLISVEDP